MGDALLSTDALKVPEAAALLRVSEDVVYRLASDGTLPARRVGGQWRFSRARLIAWLDGSNDGNAVSSGCSPAQAGGGHKSRSEGELPSGSPLPTSPQPRRTVLRRSGSPPVLSTRARLKLAAKAT